MANTKKKSAAMPNSKAKTPAKKEKKFTFDLTPLAIWLLPQLIAGAAAGMIWGTNMTQEQAAILNFVGLAIATVIMVIYYRKVLKDDAKRLFSTKKLFGKVLISAIIVLAFNIGMGFVMEKYAGIEETDNNEGIKQNLLASVATTIAMTVIFAPICEEFVFRRMLKKIFKNDIAFYIISVLLFALIHVGFDVTSVQIMPYIILGLGFAMIYRKADDNVVASIIAHMINNLAAVVVMIISAFGA